VERVDVVSNTCPATTISAIDLIGLLASDKHSDMVLKVEGEDDLRVRRSILATRSPVLQQMFGTEMSEGLLWGRDHR